MELRKLTFLFLFFSPLLALAQPANDSCSTATTLQTVINYFSVDAEYSTNGSTASGLAPASGWPSAGKDIWFKFTAERYDINITVNSGGVNGTLQSPLIALYQTDDCLNFQELIGSLSISNAVTTMYKGGLALKETYYIRISAANNNTGSFRLSVNNYSPGIRSGQDYETASELCSKESFTQTNVTGAGNNNRESAGTCMDTGKSSIEANTAWYKWTAANNGTLTFTITPTVSTDDIDWVLYDLGTADSPKGVNAANAIRCAAGHGVDNTDCPDEPIYYKTGLDFNSSDLSEAGGCGQGQNGYVKYIYMQPGHVYALLINNFSNGNNGFTIDFGGTGEFQGPQAVIDLKINQPCKYTLTSLSTNYTRLKWTFGEDASIDTASTAGPFTITYASGGEKTVILEAYSAKGCFVLATKTFTVGLTAIAAFRTDPVFPTILSFPSTKVQFFNESKDADSYLWNFGDGGTSTDTDPEHEYTKAGKYNITLVAFKNNGCDGSVTKGTLIITASNTLFIPNTFTPNGDNINDEFVIITSKLLSYRIRIYNRWGTPVFESADLFDYWKGTYQGEPLPAGVYYYAIDAVGIDNNKITKAGSITIIR